MGFVEFVREAIAKEAYGEIPKLCWDLQKQENVGFVALHGIYKDLFQNQNYSIALEIYRNTPSTNPLKGLGAYYAAIHASIDGDIFRCKQELQNATTIFQDNKSTLITDKNSLHFTAVLVKQSNLITPELSLSDTPATSLNLSEVGDHHLNDRPFFVFASCNGVYFDRFAEDFLSSVSSNYICHVHVINPSPDFDDRWNNYQTRFPNLRFTTESGPEEATYYACRRFQVLGELMKHYKKSVVVSDIDTHLHESISSFEDLQDISTGLFERENTAPMLQMHLSLSFYGYTPSTLTFLDSLDRYLTKHMKHHYIWMLDQCAYLTCAQKSAQQDDEFTFLDLGKFFDRGLSHFQVNQSATVEEKYELRGMKLG